MKVRDILKVLADDGLEVVRTRGSHRQMGHPEKKGAVTVAGKSGIEIPVGTLMMYPQASAIGRKGREMKYTVVIEKGDTSFGAYVPDLPGCVSVGETREEALNLIREAIEFHLEGMKEEGQSVPEPRSETEYVEVASA